MQRQTQLANDLWPLLLPRIQAMIAAAASGSGGGTGGGAVNLASHDLGGSLHKGTLRNDQAPQFLLTDGTRSLAGSLAVDAGMTIDGVDISAHAADPNAHHAVATAGVGISITGQQVGLAAGANYQFIGTGSGTSAGWRNVSELAGVGLSAAAGVLAVGVANTGAAGLSVEADLVRLTSNSNPGAAASVLATDASGYMTVVRASATDRLRSPLLDTAAGPLTLQPTTDVLLQPTSNLVKAQAGVALQAYNYASQVTGWRVTQDGQGDFRYLYVDEMHAKSFIADLEQALAGGQIICKSVTSLASTFTAPIITFRAKASNTATTTSLAVDKPAGTLQYDVMLASIIHSASTSVSAAPAGWTLLLTRTQGTTVLRVYWKPAGAAEGANYTWTLANSGRSLGTIYSFVNVDNAAPIEASASQGNTSSTSVTAPTITTVTQGTMLLLLAGFYDTNVTGATATEPSGFVEREDTTGGTNTWSYGAEFFYVGPGVVPPQSAILTTAHLSAAAMIALKPTASPVGTITVRDLPSAEHMQVFQSGDVIRIRQFSRYNGSLDITNCWGTVSNPVDNNDKTQTWTFTRSAAPYAGAMAPRTQVAPDAIILDYGVTGNGFYEVNAIDGLYGANSPYWQIVSWATHPATGQTVRARGGNLYGIFAQANEYGLYAGSGTANTDSYLRISNTAVRLNNVPLQLWNGANQTVNISSTGTDVWIGPNSADKRLTWDGSTLAVTGSIYVSGGNAATTSNITGAINLVQNSSFELDSNADGLANAFNIYNNDAGAVPTTAQIVTNAERSTKAQRINWSGTNASTKGIYFSTGTHKANVPYVITFWCRTNTSVPIALAHNIAPAKVNLSWPTAGTSWQFFAVKCTWASDNTDSWYITINPGQAIANGWIDFDNVMVYEGDSIVPYQPAPTDTVGYGGLVNMPAAPGTTAGLYLTSTNMGYWDGSNWKTWLASTGQFYFGGSTGASLRWDGTKLSGYDGSNNEQWYASASDGKLYAGGTNVRLASDGVRLLMSDTANGYNEVKWANTHTSTPEFRILSIRNADNTVTSTISTQAQTAGKSATLYIAAYKQDATFGNITLLGNVSVPDMTATSVRTTGSGNAIWVDSRDGYSQFGIYNATNYLRFWTGAGDRASIDSNGNFAATGNAGGASLSTSGGGIYSDNVFQMLTNGGGAQSVRAGTLLASSTYAHSARVPATGIYSLGAVHIGNSWGTSYALDVGGEARVVGAIRSDSALSLAAVSTPATSATYYVIFIDSADGKLKYKTTGGTVRTLSYT